MPPQLIAGKTTTKVFVPPEAANSEVGFQNEIISVEEGRRVIYISTEIDIPRPRKHIEMSF